MSIGNSLNTALAGLRVASAGIDLTSRNIGNANNPAYTRKTQGQTTDLTGAPMLDSVRRTVDAGLRKTSRDAASNTAMLDVQSRYATQISLTFGAPADANSLSTLTSALGDSFQSLATRPEADIAYTEVVNAAKRVADGIRGLYQQAETVRTNAESELTELISTANQKIELIDGLNKKIIADSSGDTTDLQDQRDEAISSLAAKLDITTFDRSDGGISVYTKSGTMLVDVSASKLLKNLDAGTGAVELLVQLTSGSVSTTQVQPRSGAMAGLLDVINKQVPDLMGQLDSFAGTLTTAVSEPAIGVVGVELFKISGATTYNPAAPKGYGATIAVNTDIVSKPQLIRDGNPLIPTLRPPGDTTVIDAVVGVFQKNGIPFTDFNGLGNNATNSLAGAASDIITGQSSKQANFAEQLATKKATQTAIDGLVSSDSGVSLDTEFSHLLQLQQAYAANARIVSTTQSLFNTLMIASGGPGI